MADKIDHGMILAAGLGTRMHPITNTIPKPLVSVDGQTILDRNIDALEAHNVGHIVVNGHYLIDILADHLANHRNRTITLSEERDVLLDQGGGIKNALPHLGDGSFFVLNGDAFWQDKLVNNLAKLEAAWDPNRMDALLMVVPMENATGFDGPGDFFLTDDNQVRFRDDASSAPYVFPGVGIYKTSSFAAVHEDAFPLVPMYRKWIEQERLFGVELEGHWYHIGTPSAIEDAEVVLAEKAS